eukprot:scaffold92984_cov21-Tisochrysis_lutea.AAC.2
MLQPRSMLLAVYYCTAALHAFTKRVSPRQAIGHSISNLAMTGCGIICPGIPAHAHAQKNKSTHTHSILQRSSRRHAWAAVTAGQYTHEAIVLTEE